MLRNKVRSVVDFIFKEEGFAPLKETRKQSSNILWRSNMMDNSIWPNRILGRQLEGKRKGGGFSTKVGENMLSQPCRKWFRRRRPE